MSRPEKPIDWAKVDQLLMAGCKGTQIAPHFDMHPETFYDRVKEKHGVGFTEYCALKKDHGDSLLHAKQFEKALKGDNTMLVWLGKNRMGQKDREELTTLPPLADTVDMQNENMALKAKIAALEAKLADQS